MKIDINEFSQPCGCGKQHAILVQDIFIERNALEKLPELLQQPGYANYKKPLVICDNNTFKAAGSRVVEMLGCGCIELSAENLHANEKAVEKVSLQLPADVDLLLAVGSGTIHDITRYVAHEKNLPFIAVPTAASVDGFVSTVAAMTWYGFKQSFSSSSPICVIADSSIFSKAPYRLTASGISDLLGKYTALADWRIAHILTGEYLCERIFALTKNAVDIVATSLDALRGGEAEAYEKLMYGLLLSGLAMQMMGNSRPASGAEHHMSHLWEMEILNPTIEAYHGEKVSVGLRLAVSTYQHMKEEIRAGRMQVVDHYQGMETEVLKKYFGAKGMYETILKENTPDPLMAVNLKVLQAKLPEILAVLDDLPSVGEIEALLCAGSCVMTLRQIGIGEELLKKTLQLSPYIRNRLTFMRLSKLFV